MDVSAGPTTAMARGDEAALPSVLGAAAPVRVMLLAIVACAAGLALALLVALTPPWLGLTLAPGAPGEGLEIVAVAPDGPAAQAAIRPGQRLLALAPARDAAGIALLDGDLIEEPDTHETYAQYRAFMARQSQLAALLAAPEVALRLAGPGAPETSVVLRPQDRPLGALPLVFWVQAASAIACLVIGAWVWSLRRSDAAARLFALSGAGLFVAAICAAGYSTRELAVEGGLFRLLSAANHFGAYLFGAAMIALFLIHPRRLVPPRALLVLPAVLLPLYATNVAHGFEELASGIHLPISAMMLGIVALVLLQWVLARRDPVTRAALRWMGLSVVAGSGAFVIAIAVPPLFGHAPVISQGYAFAFFVLVYAGIALGIRRYRLFDLGTWSFLILFYAAGALLLAALDAALIVLLNLDQAPAFGIALLVIGFLYLPLRDALGRRLLDPRRLEEHEVFGSAMNVAFAPTAAERAERWRALLARLFDPLEVAPLAAGPAEPRASGDGVEMVLPAIADAPPLALRFPFRGRGLFGPPQLKLVRQLAVLIAEAAEARDAHARGVAAERQRIARDLHDDVGARLLTGLHGASAETRPVLQAALTDIRSIVSGLAGERAPLDRVLAEIRHETARRLEAAGITLDWPLLALPDAAPLDYREAKALTSALREIVSNVIRHAGARRFTVQVAAHDGVFTVETSDDGAGFDPASATRGFGLASMRQRIEELGGSLAIGAASGGTRTTIRVPLAALGAR